MKMDQNFIDLMEQQLRLNLIPILLGRAGIGKTSVLRAAAEKMNAGSFTLAVNLLADKADITGARLIQENDTYRQAFFPHEDINEAIDYAEANPDSTAVLILDEVNRTSGDVTSGILGICTDRKVGRRRLPKNLTIAATGNDEGNVVAFDEASVSRFVVFRVEADAHVFMDYMGDRLNAWIREVLEADPDLINGESTPEAIATDQDDSDQTDRYSGGAAIVTEFGTGWESDQVTQITTPRTLEYLSNWLADTSTDQLGTYLATPATIGDRRATRLDELVQGFVGNTTFAHKLVGVIARDLGLSQTATSTTVIRPAAYDALRQATTMTGRLRAINAMTDDERADVLVYALTDSEDTSGFITLLAENVSDLGDERGRTLLELANEQRLDSENVRAFLESGTEVGDHYESYLGSFI